MSIEPDKFLHHWSASEFYLLVNFHSWEAHAQNQYGELMRIKAKG